VFALVEVAGGEDGRRLRLADLHGLIMYGFIITRDGRAK
jgi:hypothetical protein